MQTTTILGLFCTIVVLLIGTNDGATTVASKVVHSKVDSPVEVNKNKKNVGSRGEWRTKLDPRSKKVFNDNKKLVLKKLQEVHKVPPNFNPKPQKVSSQLVAGMLYHYLVKLPVNKFAYVTIHDRPWQKGVAATENHVKVSPQLYALNDKEIKWSYT